MNSSILIIGIVVVIGVLWFSWIIADQTMAKAASIPHGSLWRNRRWYGQLACRIALIGVAIAPLVILGNMLITAPFQTLTYSGLSGAHNSALENFAACPDSSGVELTLTMRSLDSAQESANADLSLCVGDQVLRNLTLVGNGARPLSGGLTAAGLSADFLRSTFRVSYLGSTPETPLNRTATIESMLNQTDPSNLRGPVDLGTITIPLVGNPISYPLDSYSAAGLWVVSVPTNMEVRTSDSTQVSWTSPINVVATPNAGDIDWSWGNVPTLGDVIEANRIPSIKYFVLIVAGLPLLLFIGLLALVRPIINDPDQNKFPAELLVGVGAFLLAILPVRAVLVSSDISQITVTDYILGTEMTVMIASSVMIVLAGAMRPGKNANSSQNKDTASGDHSPFPVISSHLGKTKTAQAGTDSPNDPNRADQSEAARQRGIPTEDAGTSIAADNKQLRGKFIGSVALGLAGLAVLAEVRQFLKRERKIT